MTDSIRKTAIITGAARGIGLGTVRRFLAEGWNVVMIDIRGTAVQEAARDLGANSVLAVKCDVSAAEQVQDAVDRTLTEFGRIDALVNNAGIAVFGPTLETRFEDWSRVLAVNLSGPFLCTQACARATVATGGGAVVNITSISGLRASTLRVAYGTSKAALAHLTKQHAAEFGEMGIRVNAVAPGPVETAMAKQVHSPDIRADYHRSIPLNRYGTAEEIANAIYFLCCDRSSYITGQTLAVDGGFETTGIGLASLRATE